MIYIRLAVVSERLYSSLRADQLCYYIQHEDCWEVAEALHHTTYYRICVSSSLECKGLQTLMLSTPPQTKSRQLNPRL